MPLQISTEGILLKPAPSYGRLGHVIIDSQLLLVFAVTEVLLIVIRELPFRKLSPKTRLSLLKSSDAGAIHTVLERVGSADAGRRFGVEQRKW